MFIKINFQWIEEKKSEGDKLDDFVFEIKKISQRLILAALIRVYTYIILFVRTIYW